MTTLTTIQPARDDIIRLIESNPKLQPSTKKQYTKAITGYLDSGNRLTDADALATYAQGLSKSSCAFLKAAIRLWGDEVALKAKAGATPENIGAVQATVYRVDALNEAIKVEAARARRPIPGSLKPKLSGSWRCVATVCQASVIGLCWGCWPALAYVGRNWLTSILMMWYFNR